MTTPLPIVNRGRAIAALEPALLLLGLAFVALFAWVVVHRIAYPFEIDWIEGAVVQQMLRVVDGRPVYAEPCLEWTALIYPPFYFDLSAPLTAVFGRGFVPLRVVSVVATLACLALLYAFVRRESGSRFGGLVAASLYLATFEPSGGFLDAGRVDSLGLALILAGAFALRFGNGLGVAAAAGLCFAISFVVKQSALLTLLPLLPWVLVRSRREALALALSFVVPLAGHWLFMNAQTDGWYQFFAFVLPAQHPIWKPSWIRFWTHDLFLQVPIGCAMAALALAAAPFARRWRGPWWFYGLFAAGLVGNAWSGRLHTGGWLNVLMPAFAAMALVAGLVAAEAARTGRWPGTVALAALGVQLALLLYDPSHHIPTAADRRGGEQVLATIRSFPGEVLVPNHPYLVGMVGKEESTHTAYLWDVLRADAGEVARKLRADYARALTEKRFDAIILDDDDAFPIFDMVEFPLNYRPERRLFADESTFRSVTGTHARPASLWVRR